MNSIFWWIVAVCAGLFLLWLLLQMFAFALMIPIALVRAIWFRKGIPVRSERMGEDSAGL